VDRIGDRDRKEVFSTHEAARVCRVTPMTVIRWIEEGRIPAFKTAGGHRRILRPDLFAFCRQRGIPVGGEPTARVLVVAPDAEVREVVVQSCRRACPDAEIAIATDAFEAGHLVHELRPGLVFLDSRAHGMDPHAICARLSRGLDLPQATVVVLLPGAGRETEDSFARQGAFACVPRPVGGEVLDRAVASALPKEWLRRFATGSTPPISPPASPVAARPAPPLGPGRRGS
jgi:excisionase family DNA binding protein